MAQKKFAIGAIVGAIAGVVVGVLTASKSGRETRADLKLKAEELKAEAAKKKKEAEIAADKIAGDVKAKAEEVKTRTENAIEGAKSGFSKKQ